MLYEVITQHADDADRNELYDDITLVLTDADEVGPDSTTATLSIKIVDDVPEQVDGETVIV